MADIIQGLGLLEKFSLIFPFLFVLVFVYAIFVKTKILGENKGVAGIIALALAVIVLLTPKAITVINYMAPWFVILFIFAIFLLMGIMALGPKESDVLDVLKGERWGFNIILWIIVLSLIIGLGSLAQVGFGGKDQGIDTGNLAEVGSSGSVGSAGEGAFWAVLTHPQVLGLALILLVGMFTLQRLAGYE